MTTQQEAQGEPPRASRKLIAEWFTYINVEIWDQCECWVRLYEDRTLVEMPQVKPSQGESNSWFMSSRKFRIIDRRVLEKLKRFAAEGADESRVFAEVCRDIYGDSHGFDDYEGEATE